MALGTFAAGAYTGIYTPPGGSPVPLGITQEGYKISWRRYLEKLNRSDSYGRSTIETFDQGLDVFVSTTFHERKEGPMRIVSPWNYVAATGATNVRLGVIGKQGSDQAGSLALAVIAGTPSATNGPATMTISLLQLDEQSVDFVFDAQHQMIPFMGQVLPYYDSGSAQTRYLTAT